MPIIHKGCFPGLLGMLGKLNPGRFPGKATVSTSVLTGFDKLLHKFPYVAFFPRLCD